MIDRSTAKEYYNVYPITRSSVLQGGTTRAIASEPIETVAAMLLDDYDLVLLVSSQCKTVAECVERCKQIMVLKGEL